MVNLDKPTRKRSKNSEVIQKYFAIRIIAALSIFIALFLLYFLLSSVILVSFTTVSNGWIESNVNNVSGADRKMTAKRNSDKNYEIQYITYYFDLQDKTGNIPARTVSVDVRREYYLPLIIFFALIIPTPMPVRKKLILAISGLAVLSLYLYAKFYVTIFDNYNSPDYVVIHLTGIKSFMVYHGMQFLVMTGSSTIAVIPIVVWLVFSIGEIFKLVKE